MITGQLFRGGRVLAQRLASRPLVVANRRSLSIRQRGLLFSCAPPRLSPSATPAGPVSLLCPSVSFQPSVAGPFLRRSFSSEVPDHEMLSMPALSPTMEKGNIVAWKKQVGDK